MADDFDGYLRKHFPETTDVMVVRVITDAVSLADDVRRNTPWLSNMIGEDLTGLLRRAAAMWRLHQACKAGDLPFNAEEIPNFARNCHLLRIAAGPFEAHVLRTESPRAFPKEAPLRQDKRLTNQPNLFDNPKIVPLNELVKSVQKSYAWLLFNATEIGALTHVCWGMPEAEQDRFLAHHNILHRVLSLGLLEKVDVERPPKPDPKQAMKFKKHIEARLKRSDRDKDSKKG